MVDYRNYRKYLEPEYGEMAPWVAVGEPQNMDLKHPAEWRHKANLEAITEFTNLYKPLNCYEPLMSISITDTAVMRGGYAVPLRVYHPVGEGPFPVMVFYHGGGWCLNSIEVYDHVCRYFARYGGIAVVSAGYRLAPEHPFPAGMEDAYAALCWTAENAASFDGDSNRMVVCGDSAGGNLSAVMCLATRDRAGPAINGQILIYPATILDTGGAVYKSMERYKKGYFLELGSPDAPPMPAYFSDAAHAALPYASPLLAESLRGLPRACFVSAECDPLLDQALMYAARLQDENVPVEYHLYKGTIHAFINRPYQQTFEAFDAMINFVKIL